MTPHLKLVNKYIKKKKNSRECLKKNVRKRSKVQKRRETSGRLLQCSSNAFLLLLWLTADLTGWLAGCYNNSAFPQPMITYIFLYSSLELIELIEAFFQFKRHACEILNKSLKQFAHMTAHFFVNLG